ncbi:MAG: TonB-dependent receptor [Sediminibacterium sp.]|nr:TonB-dependent receptor [Sediminibacterium sp.]
MRLPVFLLFFSLSVHAGYAQYTVSGRVFDSLGTPLGFATVTLKDSAKGKVSDAIADSAGFFKITKVEKGRYDIKSSRVNYLSKTIKLYVSSDNNIDIQLGLDANIIQNVTVTTNTRSIIERKADRLILNVANNISLSGKNTFDLLKFSPGIYTNGEAIKMAGRDNIVLLINDLPVYLSGKNLVSYLNSLPIDQILSIEVIPTPPARYDASGNTGMINIILKKNILPGITCNLKLDYLQTTYSGYFVSGNMSYKGKKVSVLTLLSGYNATYLNLTESAYSFPERTLKNYNPKKWNYQNMSGQMLVDYQLAEKTLINLNYGFNAIDKNSVTDITNRVEYYNKNNMIDSSMYTQGTTSPDATQHNISLLLDKKLTRPEQKVTLQTAWLTSNSNNQRPFSSYTESGGATSLNLFYKTEGLHRNNIYTTKLDFALPFKTFSFSFGGKLTYINNRASSDFYNKSATVYIKDPSQSNSYTYEEQTQALYTNFNKTVGKWSLQGGLRFENSTSTGNSATGQVIHNKYLELFPTAYASYSVNVKNNLSFSYGKRINRPSFEYLDPFKWYITKFFYATGNPFLTPSFVHNAEFNYLYNSNFNIKLYFSKMINGFGRIVVLDPDSVNVQKQTVENYINKSTFGINLYQYYSKIKWIETVMQLDFDYEKYVSKNASFVGKDGVGGTFSLYNTIYITKNKKVQAVVNVQETIPGVYEYRSRSNSFNLDLGFNYIFPGNHFEIDVYASDVTKSAASRYWYYVNNVRQEYANYFDNRQIMLTAKYKFGNRFIKNISRTLINEDEKNRLK